MMMSKDNVEDRANLAEVYYLKNGIVTRNEVKCLDMRPFGRQIASEIRKRGYESSCYLDPFLEGYSDYTGVLFDLKRYSIDDAINYLKENILNKFDF